MSARKFLRVISGDSSTIVSVEVISFPFTDSDDIKIYLYSDNALDTKIDVTAMQFLLV